MKGEPPSAIPVQGVDVMDLYVNPGAAEKMGVMLPAQLIQTAKVVVD